MKIRYNSSCGERYDFAFGTMKLPIKTCICSYIQISYCITPLAWVEIQCFALTAYMLTCLHAYMRTCLHAYMLTRLHAYLRASLHAYMLTRLHAYTLTCMCVHVCTLICFNLLRHDCVSTCLRAYMFTGDPM